jgi:hypothetical protein
VIDGKSYTDAEGEQRGNGSVEWKTYLQILRYEEKCCESSQPRTLWRVVIRIKTRLRASSSFVFGWLLTPVASFAQTVSIPGSSRSDRDQQNQQVTNKKVTSKLYRDLGVVIVQCGKGPSSLASKKSQRFPAFMTLKTSSWSDVVFFHVLVVFCGSPSQPSGLYAIRASALAPWQ